MTVLFLLSNSRWTPTKCTTLSFENVNRASPKKLLVDSCQAIFLRHFIFSSPERHVYEMTVVSSAIHHVFLLFRCHATGLVLAYSRIPFVLSFILLPSNYPLKETLTTLLRTTELNVHIEVRYLCQNRHL